MIELDLPYLRDLDEEVKTVILMSVVAAALIFSVGIFLLQEKPEPAPTYVNIDAEAPIIEGVYHDAGGKTLGEGDIIQVTIIGEPGKLATFDMGARKQQTMRAYPNGTYVGRYVVKKGDTVADARVVGRLRDSIGNAITKAADDLVTISAPASDITSLTHNATGDLRNGTVMKVVLKGKAGGLAHFTMGNLSVSMEELDPGVYVGAYKVKPKENVEDMAVTAELLVGGERSVRTAGNLVTFDTMPPVITSLTHNATKPLKIGDTLRVTLEGESWGTAWFDLGDIRKGIPVRQSRIEGVYVGDYTIRPGDSVVNASITGYLQDEAGNAASTRVVTQEKEKQLGWNILFAVCFFILVVPPFLIQYRLQKKVEDYEKNFPAFLSNLHSTMESKIPLPTAIAIIKDAEYGKLSSLIKVLHNRIQFGVPFPHAFHLFGKEARSRSILSSVSVLLSSYKAGGGKLSEIFGVTADNFRKIKTLQKDRISHMRTHVITGYIVFVVFVAVLIMVNNTLFVVEPAEAGVEYAAAAPGVGGLPMGGGLESNPFAGGIGSGIASGAQQINYGETLFYLFFIQAFFSGLAIGELSEGNLLSGLKHSLILMFIAFIGVTFFLA
jgi:hypothetical protein